MYTLVSMNNVPMDFHLDTAAGKATHVQCRPVFHFCAALYATSMTAMDGVFEQKGLSARVPHLMQLPRLLSGPAA